MNDKTERRKDIEQIVTKHLTDDFCNTYVFGNDVDDCIIEIMKYYEEEIGKLKVQTDETRQAEPLVSVKFAEIIDEIAELHPYKQPGNRDSYSSYNEGWEDACDRIKTELESKFSR